MEQLDIGRPTEPNCGCERQEVRARTQSNGVVVYVPQCLKCGRAFPAVKKDSLTPVHRENLKPFDNDLRETWDRKIEEHYRTRREYVRTAIEAERAEKDSDWWQKYNAYLLTDKWKAKSHLVIQRDKICQGCMRMKATVAHHLTYAHVFNEFLFELTGLCQPCHDRYHAQEVNDDRNTASA